MGCVRRCIKDGCSGCVKRYAKDDMVIRMVTNIVMMIADADIIFSVLFLHVLYKKNTFVSLFFFSVCMIGLWTYLWGAVWFGPRRKREVARLVFEYMKANPDKCTVTGYRMYENNKRRVLMTSKEADDAQERDGKPKGGNNTYIVGIVSPVYPPGACPDYESQGRTFEDLQFDSWSSNKDITKMRDGLTCWKLGHIWNTIDRANVWNVTERHHSVPLYRLAVNGFLARPSGEDLSGILNAMALYAFTCGFSQLTIGIIMIAQHPEDGSNPNQAIPLCISGLSLLFSIVNIICDFPAALREADIEKEMTDSILIRNRELREAIEDIARSAHSDMLEEGKKDFESGMRAAKDRKIEKIKQGPPAARERAYDDFKNERMKLERAWGQANMKAADFLKFSLAEANNMDRMILEVELDEYRKSKEAIERAQKGDCEPTPTLQQSILRAEEAYDKRITELYLDVNERFFVEYKSNVDRHVKDSADAAAFKAKMKKTLKEYADKVDSVKSLPHNSNPTNTITPPV